MSVSFLLGKGEGVIRIVPSYTDDLACVSPVVVRSPVGAEGIANYSCPLTGIGSGFSHCLGSPFSSIYHRVPFDLLSSTLNIPSST